ncbi:toxic anion resistance protein [Brevibacillus dissolubilis]|uniref:toxic anion resistance protein n=1 Tax=Brevibacillus dissolubilis TaxID=1844116 RepID=UPI0011160CA7|nr:toxic anion resistance protein [Brevibacillus dissolubilis]
MTQISLFSNFEESKPAPTNGLSTEEQAKVTEIARMIDVNNPSAVLTFGTSAQKDMKQVSGQIIEHIRAKDAGPVGEIVSDLLLKIKDVDVSSLQSGNKGFLASIPFFGNYFDAVRRTMAKYQKVENQIETITVKLEEACRQLIMDNSYLENLYRAGLKNLQDLNLHIEAGKLKVQELNEVIIPERRARAEATQNPIELQELNDLVNFAERLEKRVHDLIIAKTVNEQSLRQTRMAQGGQMQLTDKIRTSIDIGIPAFQTKMGVALVNFRMKKANELQKDFRDTMNQVITETSEMMKNTSIDIAKENEKDLVSIEAIKKSNDDIIFALEEILKIREQGKQQRIEVQKELERLEGEFNQKLLEAAQRRTV